MNTHSHKNQQIISLSLNAEFQLSFSSAEISLLLVYFIPGPLNMENIIYEETRGLSSVFHIKCNSCGQLNTVNTSEQHRTGKRGPPASDINSRVVLGSLHAGIGQTQLNNFLSVLNIPSINSVLFKRREREIGNATEMVAKGSCTASLDIEKLAYENSKTEKDDLTDSSLI